MRKIFKRWLLVFMTVVLVMGYNCNVFAHESESAMVGSENTQEAIEIDETLEVNEAIAEAKVELQEFETELDNKSVFVSVDEKIENQPEMFSGHSAGKIQSISDLEQLPMVCDEVYENTNPNYAYGVAANTEYTGSITTEGEIRWYAFDITEQTKVSILIRSVETLDADIFLFKLDTSTMQLVSTNLSASRSGAEEYFSCVLDSGIYYFAILGASGNGMYVLDFFENAQYIDEEINDSVSTAQIIGAESGFNGGSVTGIIDTMRDADYYKINVTYAPVLVRVDFSAPGNNTFVWIDSESSAEMLSYNNNMFILAPGTHYFAVYDVNREFYIGNGTYTVSIEVISGNLTKDMKATAYSYLPAYDIIIQFYPDRTRYYINGKYINLSCSYSGNIGSNVNNSQYRRWMINLNSGKSLIYNLKEVKMDYQSVLENKSVSKVYILEIGTTDGLTTFGSQYIQRSTTSSNKNINYAIVAIDAFDGTVADILTPDPNPFDRYDYSVD